MVEYKGHEVQPDINVLLTASVEGIGEKGEIVSMRPNAAYNKVLLPGFGTYSEIKADETKERLVSETFNAKRVSYQSDYGRNCGSYFLRFLRSSPLPRRPTCCETEW